MYQIVIKYPERPKKISNGHKIFRHCPIKDPPKFTQIWIFGLKTNHLASLSFSAEEKYNKKEASLFETPNPLSVLLDFF
jgi:hypothetical protein